MAEVPDRLSAALSGRYTLERQLGRGGMATVYLAQDLKHKRRVAIKVLRPELTAALGPERFLREIELAAGLQHPNILPLYDSGDAAGSLYYAMPYVEGETLRDLLEREGPLPIGDAVRIARELADALSYAHSHGVVHRDIKPENVLLSSGHALVADFGIARAVSAAGGTRLTETGIALGTPAYMSPEQASGATRIDGRSDLYSLGCVVYEMLAGTPPFSGSSAQALLARHTLDPVPPLRSVRKTVPAGMEGAVMRALEKVPADRFSSVLQFADALEVGAVTPKGHSARPVGRTWRVVVISVGVALMVGVVWIASRLGRGPGSDMTSVSPIPIVVLPFRNLGETTDAFFAEGVTEELNDALVRIQGFAVRPRATVAAEVARESDIKEVSQRLGATYVIDGSARRAGQRVRVNVELIRGDIGATIWSHAYEANAADIFAVQESIATEVATALSVRLTANVRAALARRGTQDAVAYDLYLQAKHFINLITLPGAERAVALYQEAIARDSTFADAWVGLAQAYELHAQLGGEPPAETRTVWRRAVDRAISLDSLNGEALAERGIMRWEFDWDFVGADADFRSAIGLSPGSADAYLVYAQFLNVVRLDDSSLVVMQHAIELNPTDPFFVTNLAARLRFLGRLDDAIAESRRALAMDSTQWVARLILAWVAVGQGRDADAALEAERARQIVGDNPFVLGPLARYCGLAGKGAEARAALAKLTALAQRRYVERVFLAEARLGVGDKRGALDLLEESAREREPDLPWRLASGTFKALQAEPRYQALLSKIGLTVTKSRG